LRLHPELARLSCSEKTQSMRKGVKTPVALMIQYATIRSASAKLSYSPTWGEKLGICPLLLAIVQVGLENMIEGTKHVQLQCPIVHVPARSANGENCRRS
jgi:hypothetical protein